MEVSLQICSSRSGFPTATCGKLHLHSLYHPKKEALRFLQNHASLISPVFLVLGEGLGYLSQILAERYPASKIVALHYEGSLEAHSLFQKRSPSLHFSWSPRHKETLHHFLLERLKEWEIPGITVLEWPPSQRVFPTVHQSAQETLANLLKHWNANLTTTRTFGLKWIKNSLANFLLFDHYCTLSFLDRPVVLVGSGPSLQDSLCELEKVGNSAYLWALPSALVALQSRKICPDLLVSTDPGFYASFHLQALPEGVPIAMPLSAQRGGWQNKNPPILLSQGTFYEDALWHSLNLHPLRLPSMGTVAATALLLAQELKCPLLYLVGVDFCFKGIQTHVHPDPFFSLLDSRVDRYTPQHSLHFERVVSCLPKERPPGSLQNPSIPLQSIPLSAYQGWFTNVGLRGSLPAKRICPSPVPLGEAKIASLAELFQLKRLPPKKKSRTAPLPNRTERKKLLLNTLLHWENLLGDALLEKGPISLRVQEILYFIHPRAMTAIRENPHEKVSLVRGALSRVRSLRTRYARSF